MGVMNTANFFRKMSRVSWQRFFLILIVTAYFPFGVAHAREAVSVAVVNVAFLMENAPQSEAASNQLKEKFLPQEKRLAEQLEEINKLEVELQKIISS